MAAFLLDESALHPTLDAERLQQGRVLSKTERVHSQADLDGGRCTEPECYSYQRN